MENITFDDLVASEPPRVSVFTDFQDASGDVARTSRQETLDIVAINWTAPFQSPLAADRLNSSKTAEAHPTDGRPARVTHDLAPSRKRKYSPRHVSKLILHMKVSTAMSEIRSDVLLMLKSSG